MWELCSGLSILTSLAPMQCLYVGRYKSGTYERYQTMWLAYVVLYYWMEIMLNWSGSFLLLSITTLFVCEAFMLCNKFCLDLLFSTESPPSSHNQIAFVQTKWFNHQCSNGRLWCLTDWLTESEIINQKM